MAIDAVVDQCHVSDASRTELTSCPNGWHSMRSRKRSVTVHFQSTKLSGSSGVAKLLRFVLWWRSFLKMQQDAAVKIAIVKALRPRLSKNKLSKTWRRCELRRGAARVTTIGPTSPTSETFLKAMIFRYSKIISSSAMIFHGSHRAF